MNSIHRMAALALLAAFTVACNGDAPTALNTDGALQAPTALSGQTTADVEVFEFDGTPVPGGSSKITRTANGANSVLHTSGLEPGHAHTMWMVVFNVPDECATTPCTGDDVAPGTAAMVDVIYVAGHVVGGSGKATFSGRRAAGDNSKSVFADLGAPAPGLIDPLTAEMHLVVRTHGPKVPGQVSSQIHTFEGTCTPGSSFGLGDGGNECEDIQFAIHSP